MYHNDVLAIYISNTHGLWRIIDMPVVMNIPVAMYIPMEMHIPVAMYIPAAMYISLAMYIPVAMYMPVPTISAFVYLYYISFYRSMSSSIS